MATELQHFEPIDVVEKQPSQADFSGPFLPGCYGNLLDQDGPEISWLWEGYLARGMTTLLTSQWKSGKTTLLSILLSRMREGADLAGMKVARAKPVVLSEESSQLWRPRQKALELSHVYFFCRPFVGRPTFDAWKAFIDHVAALRARAGFDLFVIDTLASFLPGNCENNAQAVTDALAHLQPLAQKGMALLYQHHPRKGLPLPGQAARGSGAFGACVDIIMEMGYCANPADADRRRKVLAFGRHQGTPTGQRVIELNAEGTDYSLRGDFLDDEFMVNWNVLRLVLEDAEGKLTCEKIRAEWPTDYPRPSASTLWRWLKRAVALGLLCREGSGKRSEPFCYWLADMEAQWKQDPFYQLKRQVEESQKQCIADLKGILTRPLPSFTCPEEKEYGKG